MSCQHLVLECFGSQKWVQFLLAWSTPSRSSSSNATKQQQQASHQPSQRSSEARQEIQRTSRLRVLHHHIHLKLKETVLVSSGFCFWEILSYDFWLVFEWFWCLSYSVLIFLLQHSADTNDETCGKKMKEALWPSENQWKVMKPP